MNKQSCGEDLNVSLYLEHSQLQQDLSSSLLECCHFPLDANILDIGCGDGRVSAILANKVPFGQVVGIDSSNNMIGAARTAYSEVPNLQFVLCKAEDVQKNNAFGSSGDINAITSFSCFHWIRSPRDTLKRLCHLLADHGEIIILTYPKESKFYQFLDSLLEEFYPNSRRKSAHYTMLSSRDYEQILENEGMKIIEFQTYEKLASFEVAGHLKAFVKSWLINFVPLPESEHESFLDFVVDKSISYRVEKEDGYIYLPYTTLTVRAKREFRSASRR